MVANISLHGVWSLYLQLFVYWMLLDVYRVSELFGAIRNSTFLISINTIADLNDLDDTTAWGAEDIVFIG
jgi:hypothetical protein